MKKLGFIKRNELVSLKGNTLSIRARKMLDYICKIGLDMYEKEHDEDGIYPITIKELKEMAEMNLKSDHSELLEELKAINKLEFETWDDKYYTQFPILAGFKVDNTKGIVEFALSPFLLRETFKKKDSNPYYHYCDLMEYKGLRSKYSKILLDLYTRYKHVSIPKLSIEKFKDMMQYPDKYKTNDIKRFVLEQAQKELLAKNNLQLDWVVEKYGRQWGCITLTIKNLNSNKKIE
ncbi:MAG: replication initiation protein, partial [Cetobacterium sp.]